MVHSVKVLSELIHQGKAEPFLQLTLMVSLLRLVRLARPTLTTAGGAQPIDAFLLVLVV